MGKRGPPPTPTAVLKMRGSWRGAVRKDEPRPEPGQPRCPTWLKPSAKQFWKRLIPRLVSMGVLSKIDGPALARYCQLWARWRETEEFLAAHPNTIPIKDKDGNLIDLRDVPHVARAAKLADQLLRLEQNFGLSPSARAHLGIVQSQEKRKEPEGKAKFFGGG